MFLRKYRQLPANLFGLLYWNLFGALMIISTFVGILSLLGVKPVEFNGEPTYGVAGFISSILLAPLMALVITIMTWLFLIAGNFLLRLFVKENQDLEV